MHALWDELVDFEAWRTAEVLLHLMQSERQEPPGLAALRLGRR